jgi:DinB superfamily
VEPRLELASLTLRANTVQFRDALNGLTPEQLQSRPGEDSSPPIWIAGHMTTARGLLASLLGATWQDPWAGAFKRGSSSKDTSRFPSVENILQEWTSVSHLLSDTFPKVTPEQLAAKAKEGTPSFDGTLAGTVAVLTFHEAYHLGQLAYIRKWLGLGQMRG